MTINTMQDLNSVNVAEYEFTGEELGNLLLESVKQMKNNETSRESTVIVSQAIQARQKVGLSQKKFAEVLGVSVRTLQAWEQGKRKPSKGAITLLKIATQHPKTLLSVI